MWNILSAVDQALPRCKLAVCSYSWENSDTMVLFPVIWHHSQQNGSWNITPPCSWINFCGVMTDGWDRTLQVCRYFFGIHFWLPILHFHHQTRQPSKLDFNKAYANMSTSYHPFHSVGQLGSNIEVPLKVSVLWKVHFVVVCVQLGNQRNLYGTKVMITFSGPKMAGSVWHVVTTSPSEWLLDISHEKCAETHATVAQ